MITEINRVDRNKILTVKKLSKIIKNVHEDLVRFDAITMINLM